MAISDKQFDSQFDKVANLVHYPWIGSGYASAQKRVLIMGHSHYAKNGKNSAKMSMTEIFLTRNTQEESLVALLKKEGGIFISIFKKPFFMRI